MAIPDLSRADIIVVGFGGTAPAKVHLVSFRFVSFRFVSFRKSSLCCQISIAFVRVVEGREVWGQETSPSVLA